MSEKGMLIVVSGFSGAGKGTVIKELVNRYQYSLSISATTREPRDGEQNGREYYFKTVQEFQGMIDYNGFIEWAQYVDNYYGTPRAFVENELDQGNNVILEIEVQGALDIRKQYPSAVLIFISAPSAAELEQRLMGRGTEDIATIRKRLKRAAEEADDMEQYDYIVINDDLESCITHVHGIVESEMSSKRHQETFITTMKNNLMTLIEKEK